MKSHQGILNDGGLVPLVAAAALFAMSLASPAHAEQRTFDSAKAAVDAMMTALDTDDVDGLLGIFGSEHEDELIGADKAAAREGRKQFRENARTMLQLREDSATVVTLVVGPEAWPFPIPVVKGDKGWRFDTDAGIEEIINRRVGENELNAIAVARTYVDAQWEYAAVDRDGDEVLEFAQQIASSKGKRDGLYWEIDEGSGEPLSPFGPLVADARDYLEGREPGDPFKGYYFKILDRQGTNPPGGRYDYVINGNMIAGHAMVAFPADYGHTGVMTFVVSHQGKVYQKDLGDLTDFLVNGMDEYDPDSSWSLVTD